MKKLIVNADDFGLHPAINAGIIKGCRDGFITSTSLMCSGAAFDDAVLQAKATPALGVGIHLTLVGGGKTLLQARQLRTLVDEDGLLPADYTVFAKRWYAGRIKKAEVVSELQAQLERGLSCGLEITHVDSQQHLHVLPGIADIVLDLCSAFGIKKIRMPQEGWFWRGGFNSTAGRLIGREGLSFCSALAKMKARQARFVYPQHFFGMLAGGNLNEFLVGDMHRKLIRRLLWMFVFVIAISAAVIYFTFDIRALEYLTMFEPWCIAAAFGILGLGLVFDGLRLMTLAAVTDEKLTTRQVVNVVLSNYFLALVTPGASGGAVAQIMFMRKAGVPVAKATVVVFVRTIMSITFVILLVPAWLTFAV